MDDFSIKPASVEEWRNLAEASLGGDAVSLLTKKSEDGLDIKALYTALDLPHDCIPHVSEGQNLIQRIEPCSDAKSLLEAIREELKGGVSAIEIPQEQNIALVKDALAEFKGETISINFGSGSDWQKLAEIIKDSNAFSCLGADPLSAFLEGRIDKKKLNQETTAVITWLKDNKDFIPITISGDHYHLLGLTPAEELATSMSAIVFYLTAMEKEGIAPDEGLGYLVPRFAVDADLYGGVIKTRAFALLLNRLATACKVKDSNIANRIHGITSGRMLTRLDTDTNILRNSTAMLALMLGGAGRMTCLPHDWLTGSSTNSRRLARNTYHLLVGEARLGEIADPAAGSYFIERMTYDLAEKSWQLFQSIEKKGGIVSAKSQITEWAKAANKARSDAVNHGDEELLGVTLHPSKIAAKLAKIKDERGGLNRPSAPWEELAETKSPKRCLLLDIGEAGKNSATQCAKWFEAIGVEAVSLEVADEEAAVKAIASAKPTLLVVSAKSATLAKASSDDCVIVEAKDFEGDKLATLKRLLVEE